MHNDVFQRPKCHPFQALGSYSLRTPESKALFLREVGIGGEIPIMILGFRYYRDVIDEPPNQQA